MAIRIPICGMQSVVRNTGDKNIESKVKFDCRTDDEIIGDVIVDKVDEDDAIKKQGT